MKLWPTPDLSPAQVRRLFRQGADPVPTAGLCPGYAQCNLMILPADLAAGFRAFAKANPFACPVLEESRPGSRGLEVMARDCDLARDFPKYRIYRHGLLESEPTDVSHLWREDWVAFLIGCSFSFEEALLEAGVPVRHIEEGRNVPMFVTDINCAPAGGFWGKLVVSMRPMTAEQARLAAQITAKMPRVHGAPVHVGDGSGIGISDPMRPDFGDSVTIKPGEVCVFWPCGVTPQSVVMNVRPPLAITHAPGHMLVCDVPNRDLMCQ